MPLDIEETRRRCEARPAAMRCHTDCKGWVLSESSESGIECCDQCFHDLPDEARVTDADVARLPEALLARTERHAPELLDLVSRLNARIHAGELAGFFEQGMLLEVDDLLTYLGKPWTP